MLFSVQHVDDPFLKPVKLLDEKLAQSDVYASPIVIVPGEKLTQNDVYASPIVIVPGEKLTQNDVYASPIVIVPGSLNQIKIYVMQFLCIPKGTR